MNGEPSYLTDEAFRQVVATTPLISIDLIVLHDHKILLGKRTNRPAKGYWFVPGGRIRKNESMRMAFKRLTLAELGTELAYDQAGLLGIFDHFYSDSVFGEEPTTHYVAAGMLLELPNRIEELPKEQHDSFTWWSIRDALTDPMVHKNTQNYLCTLLKDKKR